MYTALYPEKKILPEEYSFIYLSSQQQTQLRLDREENFLRPWYVTGSPGAVTQYRDR
jgi:hypothetical protein